jgi:hypothetical protein
MERVILVLAMLAGLHLILSFLQFAVEAIRGYFTRAPHPVATTEVVQETSKESAVDWLQYDIPAYMRRSGIGNDSGSKGTASFEVIA